MLESLTKLYIGLNPTLRQILMLMLGEILNYLKIGRRLFESHFESQENNTGSLAEQLIITNNTGIKAS